MSDTRKRIPVPADDLVDRLVVDPERLTREAVVAAVRVIVMEAPNFIYEAPNRQCVNWSDGLSDCIVGTFAMNIDPRVALTVRASLNASELFDILCEAAGVATDYQARQFLTEIQIQQDDRVPWGRAFNKALEEMNGYFNSTSRVEDAVYWATVPRIVQDRISVV